MNRFRRGDFRRLGIAAYQDRVPIEACPYKGRKGDEWRKGWEQEHEEEEIVIDECNLRDVHEDFWTEEECES